MLFALLPVALAAPVQLDVATALPRQEATWFHLAEVEPGVAQTLEISCSEAPTCRLAVTVEPIDDRWKIALTLSGVHGGRFGRPERTEVLSSPTFIVPESAFAVVHIGRSLPVDDQPGVTFEAAGMMLVARVREIAEGGPLLQK